jgi:hypothetical protein
MDIEERFTMIQRAELWWDGVFHQPWWAEPLRHLTAFEDCLL